MKRESIKKIFWMCFTLALSVLTVWTVLKQSESMSIETLFEKLADADKKWIVVAFVSALGYVFFSSHSICHRRSACQRLLYAKAWDKRRRHFGDPGPKCHDV